MKNFEISIFSKALYSSWCYLYSHQVLFDCGEGCATHLGNQLAAINHVFIGHAHGDHVLGLPSLIGCRNMGRGISRNVETRDHNKPLTIYYPNDNYDLLPLIDFIRARNSQWLRYKLEFVPIMAGYEVDIGGKLKVRAFNMKHHSKSTLGYVVYEDRKRLRPEFVGQDIPSLIKQNISRDAMTESYRKNLFAYCLDSHGIERTDEISGCDAAVMDCTFVDEKDRTDMTHFTIDEVRNLCKDANVSEVYAAHLSGRYDFNEIQKNNSDMKFINPTKVNRI